MCTLRSLRTTARGHAGQASFGFLTARRLGDDGRQVTLRLAIGFWLLLWLGAGPAFGAAPSCDSAVVSLTPDYSHMIGSARFVSGGEAESGSLFRWLTNAAVLRAGPVGEDLLLHLDGSATGANGETPSTALNVSYSPGKWSSCLALPTAARLQFSRTNNYHPDQGTVELWVALRADGTNAAYAARDHVLFQYRGSTGDYMQIAQSSSGRVLYVGGTVSGQWESAYGSLGNMSAWKAGEWHHLAFTYSASQSDMRFYVDGVLAAQNNEGHYWAPDSSGSVVAVGGDLYGNAAYYLVDEVRISSHPADGAEVAARAHRADAPQPNEVWLAATNLARGTELVFEFTPATATQTGTVCQSASLAYSGIPITNVQPPSTLLPVGATNLALLVETLDNTTCAFAVGQPLPYAQMTPFTSGGATRYHTTSVTGLSPDPNCVNDIYIRSAAHPDYLLHLQYRALAECHPPYPRTGNLWGWGEWIGVSLGTMAKVDLWLGASPRPDQVVALRQSNPHIRILTSINAVENGGLPADYYLKDIHGNRIEVWPGSYRLNLTKPYVADYQARYAHQTLLDTGLMTDGVFFDNVMTSQSWQKTDIYGNTVQIDANEDGIADDAATLDTAWKAGVFREIQAFRQLAPNAIVSGHAMDIYEPGIAALFNGISIGFSTSDVLEGRMSFASLFTRYNDWLSQAVQPAVTMIESSPMAQISYGYDYSPWAKIPAATLEFARTYYPYVRFGLALTLLNDGYFAQEYGDTWHGNDWWYDELDYNLGYPLGPAQRVDLGGAPATNLMVNGDFESAVADPWHTWNNTGCASIISRQTGNAAVGAACARCNISQTTGTDWHIEFAQYNRSLVQGVSYDLTFWARSSQPRSLTVSLQKGSPDWRNYGLYRRLAITTIWQQYTATFTANETVSDARAQFLLGETTGTVWLDDVRLTQHPPDVYRRDFNRGVVLLNATRQARDISVGSDLRRLIGSQAPMYETILDDQDTAFSVTGTWTNTSYDSGLWKATGPFYHSWAGSLHERTGASGEARWQLPITADDTYTISAWWPAAPQASNWTGQATYEVLAGGTVVASTNLDQRAQGDQWHDIGTAQLLATNAAYVRLTASLGVCVADALHLRSASRFNNGQPASNVHLQPMDGIILQRDQVLLARPAFAVARMVANTLVVTATNLTPGVGYALDRSTNLATAAWEHLQTFQTLGFTTNLTDSLPRPQHAAFYRIRSQ